MNYLEDNRGNKVDLDKYTKEQAIKMLDSLINCDNCVNCVNCSTCDDCSECEDCVNCVDCSECVNCMDLDYIFKEYDKN